MPARKRSALWGVFFMILLLFCSCVERVAPGPEGPEPSRREDAAGEEESGPPDDLPSFEVESEGEVLEAREPETPVEQVLWDFFTAMQAGDAAGMKSSGTPGMTGELAYETLAEVELDSFAYSTIGQNENGGTFLVELDVSFPAGTRLERGKGSYVVSVGMPLYAEEVAVLSVTPSAQYDSVRRAAQEPEAEQVLQLRNWGDRSLFTSPDQLNRDQLLDYFMILASQEGGGEGKYEFTREEISAAAKRFMNLDGFERTASEFYNTETGLYELWGRGGVYYNEQVTEVTRDSATGEVLVTVETYQDPLQLVPGDTVVYTLCARADGSGGCYIASAASK